MTVEKKELIADKINKRIGKYRTGVKVSAMIGEDSGNPKFEFYLDDPMIEKGSSLSPSTLLLSCVKLSLGGVYDIKYNNTRRSFSIRILTGEKR